MPRSLPQPIFLLTLLLALLLPTSALQANPQTLQLGQAQPYPFIVFGNGADQHPRQVQRVVILIHGVRRNAEDYYRYGTQLLNNAGLSAENTWLLAPHFLTDEDDQATPQLPLWPRDKWMHGSASQQGRQGIAAFSVLDDLLTYLGDRQRFPALDDVVLIGHSAGGQLLQRYSLLSAVPDTLRPDMHLRYVVSSPSSYLYLEDSRWQDGRFTAVTTIMCPSFRRYRYGLEQAPAYFQRQGLEARQVFQRYARRDVIFMVGERDNNPRARVMDHSCGARLQGAHRLERQLNYLRYEDFLAAQWGIAIAHRALRIEAAGHAAEQLLTSPQVAHALFERR